MHHLKETVPFAEYGTFLNSDRLLLTAQVSSYLQPEKCSKVSQVLYMSSTSWLLGVESRDFSYAEKERTACKDEQIHKMMTIFTQNGRFE